MITYHSETWASYFADCQELWHEHWLELAVRKERMQMKPDVEAYMALEASGSLDILVLRSEGRMVGYVLSVVRRHLHYADVLVGLEDAYFLTKSERRGMVGVRMIREWEKRMQRRGCQLIFAMTKPWLDKGLIFKRLGFAPSDHVYTKWIGA